MLPGMESTLLKGSFGSQLSIPYIYSKDYSGIYEMCRRAYKDMGR